MMKPSASSAHFRFGAKPPSSPTLVPWPASRGLLQGVEHFSAHADGFGERRGADRHDHELLNVDWVVRVRAAVDDVHHRHRHTCACARRHSGRAATRVRRPPPWRPPATRREWRWHRAGSCFWFRRATSRAWSMRRWSSASMPERASKISPLTASTAFKTPLPETLLVAVAQFHRLVRARRSAGRDRRPSHGTTPRGSHRPRRSGCRGGIENIAADDVDDGGHWFFPRLSVWRALFCAAEPFSGLRPPRRKGSLDAVPRPHSHRSEGRAPARHAVAGVYLVKLRDGIAWGEPVVLAGGEALGSRSTLDEIRSKTAHGNWRRAWVK